MPVTSTEHSELPIEDSDLVQKIALLEDALKQRSDEVGRYKKAYEALVVVYQKKKQIFGRKSETLNTEQIAFAWHEALKQVDLQGIDPADLPAPAPAENKPKPKPKHAPHARRNLEEANHLPTETIRIEPPNVPEGATQIGQDVSWKLERQRATFLRIKIVRPIYAIPGAVDATETKLVQAPPVDEMIPKGLLAPGLLAHLIVSKWDDHLPYC